MTCAKITLCLACTLTACFAPTSGDDLDDGTGGTAADDTGTNSASATTTATATASASGVTVTETAGDATSAATDPGDTSTTADGSSTADTGVADDFPVPQCGNGEIEGGEECDDANVVNTDECKNDCTLPECGDGVVGPGEQCDDGNGDDTDLCTTSCTDAACGDGFAQLGEQCDDANVVDHDGCTAQCVNEPFCMPFVGVACASGATQFCDVATIECTDMDDAIAACEACNGDGSECEPYQDVEGCNEGDGAVDSALACPARLNFVYQGDVCNNGIVVDDCMGGQLGTWCTP